MIDSSHLDDSLEKVSARPFVHVLSCRRGSGSGEGGVRGRASGPRQPHPADDPRRSRPGRLGGGPGGPFDRAPRHRARGQQKRPLRALRVQDGPPDRHCRRRSRDLPRAGDRWQPRRHGHGLAAGAGQLLARLHGGRRVPRRVLLRRRLARVRRPSGPGARSHRKNRRTRRLAGASAPPGTPAPPASAAGAPDR